MPSSLSSRPRLASSGFVLSLFLAAAARADASADHGSCHLSPWVPVTLSAYGYAGNAVAFDGDLAVVGAPGEERVFFYERTGGTWRLVGLAGSPLPPGGGFGTAVALSGTTLVVGAPGHDGVGASSGALVCYERTPAGWQHRQTIQGSTPGGLFGIAVDVATGTQERLVAGAPGGSGAAYVYRNVAGTWVFEGKVQDLATESFGSALDLDGDMLAIGDWKIDSDEIDTGAVFTYRFTPTGLEFLQKLIPDDGRPYQHYGYAIALDEEERLVVGAPDDSEAGTYSGAAYVYDWKPKAAYPYASFQGEEKIVPCDVEPGAKFGCALDLDRASGQRLVVGAYLESGSAPGGAVYVYQPSLAGTAWTVSDFLVPSDGDPDDGFGFAVEVVGDHVLAGSPFAGHAGDASGAAYLFSLTRNASGGGQCPCDVLATTIPYGSGKPGSLGAPVLSFARPPVPGEASLVRLSNALAGVQPVILWGSTPAAIPFDGGALYVADPVGELLPLVGPLNQVGALWTLPNLPALCGTEVFFQAMFLDPGASGPYRTAQSNGLRAIIGY